MPDYPAHASPAFPAAAPPRPELRDRTVSELRLNDRPPLQQQEVAPPLVSPAVTPPDSPFHAGGQRPDRQPRSIPVSSPSPSETEEEPPTLLQRLPKVWCEVRARIPTTTGQEMFLHLYHNDVDEKEHLAIVFGPHIRSRSLDAPRPGETERDRMIRGAYVGTLFPGRTSSRVEQIRKDAGVSSRPSAGYLSALNAPGHGPPSPAPSEQADGREEEEGDIAGSYPLELGPPMVRIHSECYTGETVWSARCDCGEQLDEAARLMSLPAPTPASTPSNEVSELHANSERLPSCGGVIVYLRQEGRGIGLGEKLKAYNLQDLGHDTMEANLLLRHPGDARSYGLATAMLLDLGLDRKTLGQDHLGQDRGIKLLTNNPDKVRAVEGPNREVKVIERVPMVPLHWTTGGEKGVHGPEVERYLATKIEKFKHMLSG
ncbi:hypothetical protein B0A50_05299 [Salinomyces thailandicus]|uniref:GTP cyclohydrolase II n=1 Tax=Salinomyces thailandicus TaxID=706561 RepID=A0A4U0TWQ6_9PEZI|nr:hypothetical protein B0A50_05299 [Salinomyces thailandica]